MLKIMQKTLLTLLILASLTACSQLPKPQDQINLLIPTSQQHQEPKIIIIGHRGASALRPEHTLASYQKAIDDGADFIEPDLVPTKDGYLVARHENDITTTTNVSELSQFKDRKTTKVIDGESHTGWFTEDFNLSELKQLKARERIPDVRPNNAKYNDQFEIPTLEEIIALAQKHYEQTGKLVGLYIETKHPTYFQKINLALEDRLLKTLSTHEFTRDLAPIYLQSFEVTNLHYIKEQLPKYKGLKQAQLIQLYSDVDESPADFIAQGIHKTYGDLATTEGLKNVATYAQGIGPSKNYIVNNAGELTHFVQDVHAQGLKIHPYSLRPENKFLIDSLDCNKNANERCIQGAMAEYQIFFKAGVDGVFTDDPALGRKAVNAFLQK